MHYKNGREAKVGDLVIGKDWDGQPFAGIIVAASPSSETCNISVLPVLTQRLQNVTAKTCLHIQDALPDEAPDVEQVARRLYGTYCAAVGGVAFNGDALPTWEEFSADPAKQKQAEAWREVARESL